MTRARTSFCGSHAYDAKAAAGKERAAAGSGADAPDLPVNFSEEHSAIYGNVPFRKPGDVMRIIPGHCCTTVNLYDWIYLVRDGLVVDRLPVTGRGHSV